MDSKPFVRLPARRVVTQPELPPDLAEFYAEHEGIGLESDPDSDPEWVVRLCKLDEVAQVGCKDLDLFGGDIPEEWEVWAKFAAFRVGMGIFGEEIVYVLDAPSCPPGSIFAIGTNLDGCQGGVGPFKLYFSVVLAATFPEWLAHLERWGWEEPIIAGAGDRPGQEKQELCRYYSALNSEMDWGVPKGS